MRREPLVLGYLSGLNHERQSNRIVDTNPQKFVIRLTCIEGFADALDYARIQLRLGDKYDWPIIFAGAAVIGPIAGLIGLYFFAAMISWTGKWIGGKAPSGNIRAAIAWSGVPMIWKLILWIPLLILFGQELFTTQIPGIYAKPFFWLMFLGLRMILITIVIWAFVVFLKCLGQVQGFSIWKVLYNLILTILFSIPIFILVIIVMLFLRSPSLLGHFGL